MTNRVHTTRDVIWLKRMYYNPEEAANGDELDVDEMIIEEESCQPNQIIISSTSSSTS